MKNDELDNFDKYWKATLSLLFRVLLVWFIVSYLAGIVLAPWLNTIKLGGYKLGFWFAQQGSIYVFIVLIFYYAYKMGQLDKEFDVHEK
jgi:putative solute:sodium symporter small subunit